MTPERVKHFVDIAWPTYCDPDAYGIRRAITQAVNEALDSVIAESRKKLGWGDTLNFDQIYEITSALKLPEES